MELTKKIWHDENSEPPKNYLWAKGGKLFKNIEGQWKEVSKKDDESGSNTDGDSTLFYLPFPKVIGYIDNSDYDKFEFSFAGRDCTIVNYDGEMIPPEELLNYLKEKLTHFNVDSANFSIHPIYEYNEMLVRSDNEEERVDISHGFFAVDVNIYNGNIKYEFHPGSNQYPAVWTNDKNEKYIIFVNVGD